jgi:hypothetical protein
MWVGLAGWLANRGLAALEDRWLRRFARGDA